MSSLILSFCLLFHINAKIFPPQLSFLSLSFILINNKTNLLRHDTAQFRTGVDTVRLAASPGDSSAESSLSLTSQGEQFYNMASAVQSQQGTGADGGGDSGSDDDEEKEEEGEDDEKAEGRQDPDVEEEEEEQESSEKEQESSEEEHEDSFLYSPVESFQDLGARFNEEGSLTIRAVRGQYVDEIFIVRSVQVSRRSTGRHSVTCIAQDGGTRTTSFYDVDDFEVAN